MYPLWAMSTGRDEIEGLNGGLRMRCGLSLCALSVCLFTYLWWKSLNGYLEHHFTQQHLVLQHHVVVDPAVHGTGPAQRSPRISGPKGHLGLKSPL